MMGLSEEDHDKSLRKMMDAMEHTTGLPIPKFDTIEEFISFINNLLEETK